MIFTDDDLLHIKQFAEFLKIDTISGTGATSGGYKKAVEYLKKLLDDIGLITKILPESLDNKPLLVAQWYPHDDDDDDTFKSGILLNSHYDVVPIDEKSWTKPAFAGLIENGKIYGRGAQDMKCVCIQYIIAINQLKKVGYKPTRNIYLSFVPDEEIGGEDGMCKLLQSKWYSEIKIDLALDEGLASEDDGFSVFYGERLPWWIRIIALGNTGHGSRFIDNTAVEKISHIINNALEFRELQRTLLHGGKCNSEHNNCSHSVAIKRTLGDVTTLNVTYIHAGIEIGGKPVLNVIPNKAEACFDIRISPHTPPQDISDILDKWCNNEKNTSWEFVNPGANQHAVTTTDSSNKWWLEFENVLIKKLNYKIKPQVFPAATDSRFLRAIGIKALGFSPIRNSEILLHENDEYLKENVFIEGCAIYFDVIKHLASVDIDI